MSNKKEFLKLIKTYENITIKDINKLTTINCPFYCISDVIANKLTGFGAQETCSLCKVIKADCNKCYWDTLTDYICDESENKETYMNIYNARTKEDLLNAFKLRAQYMKLKIQEY